MGPHKKVWSLGDRLALESARPMIDAGLVTEWTGPIENGEVGRALVGIATDPIMRHSCTSFACDVLPRVHREVPQRGQERRHFPMINSPDSAGWRKCRGALPA